MVGSADGLVGSACWLAGGGISARAATHASWLWQHLPIICMVPLELDLTGVRNAELWECVSMPKRWRVQSRCASCLHRRSHIVGIGHSV